MREDWDWQGKWVSNMVIHHDYLCRIFPMESIEGVVRPSSWEFGPRVCLSNFNPGKTSFLNYSQAFTYNTHK